MKMLMAYGGLDPECDNFEALGPLTFLLRKNSPSATARNRHVHYRKSDPASASASMKSRATKVTDVTTSNQKELDDEQLFPESELYAYDLSHQHGVTSTSMGSLDDLMHRILRCRVVVTS